jgi:hypothetical protein
LAVGAGDRRLLTVHATRARLICFLFHQVFEAGVIQVSELVRGPEATIGLYVVFSGGDRVLGHQLIDIIVACGQRYVLQTWHAHVLASLQVQTFLYIQVLRADILETLSIVLFVKLLSSICLV